MDDICRRYQRELTKKTENLLLLKTTPRETIARIYTYACSPSPIPYIRCVVVRHIEVDGSFSPSFFFRIICERVGRNKDASQPM